jgi:hypothetical protein
METGGSLPHAKVPATCPCPEPDQPSSCTCLIWCPLFTAWVLPKDEPKIEALWNGSEGRDYEWLEDHPLSAVRDCLFNVFAAACHIWKPFPIRSLRTRHAVVRETHLWLWTLTIISTEYTRILWSIRLYGLLTIEPRTLKANSHMPCRSHAVPR